MVDMNMFYLIYVRGKVLPCSSSLRLQLGMAVLQPHLVSVNGTSSSRKRCIGHDLQLQCAEITSSMHK